MTESLLQKLEERLQKLDEKMMRLLAEIEDSRNIIQSLTYKNSMLEIERETHAKKLADLIVLLDTISSAEKIMAESTASAAA